VRNTYAGALRQELHEVARQTHEELQRLLHRRQRDAVEIVEHDQVDIARVVELAGPALAHRQNDEAASRHPSVRGLAEPLAARRRLADQKIDGAGDRGVRALGQCRRHLEHGPDAGNVGECGQQRDFRLERAQGPHGRRARGSSTKARKLRFELGEPGLGGA
jgi:hypothetical protein